MIVELPNGQELEFPDGTSQDVMRTAILKNFPEFAPKQPEKRTGFSGVMEDIGESISGVPGALYDFVTQLPGEAYKSAKQLATHPIRAAENVGAGLLEGIKGAVNIPSNVASYLGERDIGKGGIEDFIKRLHIGDTGLEKAILGDAQEGDELLRGIGSFAPYARLGGLAKGLGGAARRGGAAALYGAGQNQDPIKTALTGLTGEGFVRALQKAKNIGFMPSSPLSAEELEQAVRNVSGTETSLGNVIENPFLQKQFENVLPNLPFSGANQAMQRTANLIRDRGEQILQNLRGDYESEDIGGALHQALKKSESETRRIKNEKFEKLNDAAAAEGVTTSRERLRSEAKNALEKIESDPDLSFLTDSPTKKLLKNLSMEKGDGNYSIKHTDFLRGKLGDKAHDAFLANNTELGKIYNSLKKAAESDINTAIDQSGYEHLDKLRDEAMSYHKKNYAPFEDREIMKFTRKGGDPDILANAFLKSSRLSDRSRLLEKLTSKLTDEERKLLTYSYFSKAITDGQLNPIKLKTLYKSLGERQRKALLGGEDQINSLRDYISLVEKNTEPLNIMFNPKTGQRTLSEFPLMSVLGGAAGSLATGSIPGGILSAALPGIAARPLVKALTSPSVREKLIKRMIESKNRSPKQPYNLAPFLNALMISSKENEEKAPIELLLTPGQGTRYED